MPALCVRSRLAAWPGLSTVLLSAQEEVRHEGGGGFIPRSRLKGVQLAQPPPGEPTYQLRGGRGQELLHHLPPDHDVGGQGQGLL